MYPEDLSGVPPESKVEFRIDLFLGVVLCGELLLFCEEEGRIPQDVNQLQGVE